MTLVLNLLTSCSTSDSSTEIDDPADLGGGEVSGGAMGVKTGKLIKRLVILTLIVALFAPVAAADDCRGVPNILVLFDASGFMKERDRYKFLLKQMTFFQEAIPITADGFFNVGLRHYGLKVGMGCDSTESILAVQPWDPPVGIIRNERPFGRIKRGSRRRGRITRKICNRSDRRRNRILQSRSHQNS